MALTLIRLQSLKEGRCFFLLFPLLDPKHFKGKTVSRPPLLSESYRTPESYRAQAALGMSYVSGGPQPSSFQQEPPPQWRRNQAMTQFVVPPLPQQSKEFVPELIDYVVQATCKRIRTIAAQKL